MKRYLLVVGVFLTMGVAAVSALSRAGAFRLADSRVVERAAENKIHAVLDAMAQSQQTYLSVPPKDDHFSVSSWE